MRATPETYGQNYLGSFEVDEEMAGISFGEKDLCAEFEMSEIFFMDATFSCSPKKMFYQIFSRIFKYKGESFLATVSCMKRKLRAHYDAENEFIIRTFPNWHPLHGMADAEKAMRSSAQQYHDGLVVKICKFHVC